MSEQPLSPQGYNIKDRPVNANPFWETSPAEEFGEVTAGANTLETGEPATATVESVENPGTGKTDLRFSFGIPEGRPGEAGEPGRGIGVVAAETNTGSGVGVHVREMENVQNNEVDLTFHFDFPTEGSGSQSLEFVLLGAYLEGSQPPSNLVSRMREFPVVGFGVAYLDAPDIIPPPPPPPPEVTPPEVMPPEVMPPEIQTRTSTSDYEPSHDIQTLIPTSELTSMKDIHLCKTFPTDYGCNVVLCVTVIPESNGTRIFYDGNVKYMAGLTRIVINGKTYYVNATTINPASQIHFGLCVWGVRLKEGSAYE